MFAKRTSKVVDVLKGHGFSRADKVDKTTWALAPEGRFLL
jgi:hypothetical protein